MEQEETKTTEKKRDRLYITNRSIVFFRQEFEQEEAEVTE
jgi:hypothetical protein